MKTVIGPHMGFVWAWTINLYKKSAFKNRLLTEAEIYMESASVNIFCEAFLYNHLN